MEGGLDCQLRYLQVPWREWSLEDEGGVVNVVVSQEELLTLQPKAPAIEKSQWDGARVRDSERSLLSSLRKPRCLRWG